ncbi:hypothetical protein J3459_016053 [Metarhizium acridum]|nr:hypothetical protein J3459_016053 [Metarhizium acridum]
MIPRLFESPRHPDLHESLASLSEPTSQLDLGAEVPLDWGPRNWSCIQTSWYQVTEARSIRSSHQAPVGQQAGRTLVVAQPASPPLPDLAVRSPTTPLEEQPNQIPLFIWKREPGTTPCAPYPEAFKLAPSIK